MKIRGFFAALLMIGIVGLPASRATAERIKENSAKANQAFNACMDNGGATVDRGGTSSCIDRGGHGIICGGVKPEHQGTCDTFKRSGRNPWGLVAAESMRMKVTRHPAR
jgi:hypothetical protein